jgi:hypothetical protein
MVALNGSVIWIPADGNQTSDYFTRDIMKSGDISRYAVFQVSQDGPFQYLLRVRAIKEGEYSIHFLAEEIMRFAKKTWPDFGGIFTVFMKAGIRGLCSSDIATSLIPAAREKSAHSEKAEIEHSLYRLPRKDSVLERISNDDIGNRYSGDTLFCFGYAVDLQAAQEKFSLPLIEQIAILSTPMHQTRIFTNISGVVLKDVPWDPSPDLTTQITNGLEKGSLISMHHLLGITTIRDVTIAIAPVSSIKPV